MRLWPDGLGSLGLEAIDEALQMLAGRLVLGFRLHLQFVRFRLLPLELIVGAAVEGELLLIEVNDRVHRACYQEVAIVADDDQPVRITANYSPSSPAFLRGKIVGRSSRSSRSGSEKGPRQAPRACASHRKGGGGRFCASWSKPRPARMLAARFRRMGADVGEPRLDLGDPCAGRCRLHSAMSAVRSLSALSTNFDQRLFRPRRFLCDLPDPRVLRQEHRRLPPQARR